jgi:hypothetical protein
MEYVLVGEAGMQEWNIGEKKTKKETKLLIPKHPSWMLKTHERVCAFLLPLARRGKCRA